MLDERRSELDFEVYVSTATAINARLTTALAAGVSYHDLLEAARSINILLPDRLVVQIVDGVIAHSPGWNGRR
jgi:hypothetical protein